MYLSGAIAQNLLADPRKDVGLMIQPGMGTFAGASLPLEFRIWGGDNGRFAAPDKWNAPEWIGWMANVRRYQPNCLFMVAPDVVGDAEATMELSVPYLPTIRQLGYRAAFVSQNGADKTPLPWDDFDCLFVGGTDAWKLSERSYELVAEAKRRGKWTHQGRVNSLQRMRASAVSGFDSCDGTFLKYGPDVNWPRLCGWLDELNSGQGMLVA